MFRVFIFLFLIFSFSVHSQVNQRKLDSLRNAIDADAKAMRAWQDSFKKVQDSIYNEHTVKNLPDNSSQYLAGKKAEELRKERRLYVRLGLAVVILVILGIAFLRKRKRTGVH